MISASGKMVLLHKLLPKLKAEKRKVQLLSFRFSETSAISKSLDCIAT